MASGPQRYGFSLTETLLAIGTLAIGLLFIGGTFMTGIYFAGLSTERTIAAAAADEALAKIQLYGLDVDSKNLRTNAFVPYEKVQGVPATEFMYPSTADTSASEYSWASICKRQGANSRLVQFTVFVSRKTGSNVKYWVRTGTAADSPVGPSDLPRPVLITIRQDTTAMAANEVSIVDAVPADAVDERTFLCDGAFLIDDATGQIYRVLLRYADRPDTVKLDRPWTGGAIAPPTGGGAWVVPPAKTSGRKPVVAVYQETLRF